MVRSLKPTALFFPLVAGVRFFLRWMALNRSQIIIEAVETLFPESAIIVNPIGYVLERFGLKTARTPLCLAATRNEAGALKYFEMLGNSWQTHVEGLGKLDNGSLASRQASQNGTTGGGRRERQRQR